MFKQWPHYPKGTILILLIFALFNIGLGSIYTALVLYLEHGPLHFNIANSYFIWGTFVALFFCNSLIGGFIGSKTNIASSIALGLLFVAFGLMLITLPFRTTLHLGLASFITGSGFFVPNALSYLGQHFKQDDYRRHSAFTLLFTFSNVGVLIAALLCGMLSADKNYNLAFSIASLSALGALLIFLNYQKSRDHLHAAQHTKKNLLLIASCMVILTISFALILRLAKLSDELILVLTVFASIYIIIILRRIAPKKRQALIHCMLLLCAAMSFWTLLALTPAVLMNFIDTHVNRYFFNIQIPTATLYSLSPIFIILIAPLITIGWLYLEKRKSAISLGSKLSFGILAIGLGYLILMPGIRIASPHTSINVIWIVLSYLLQSTGEILVAPTTQSMIGILCPREYESFLQGVRDFSIGLSGILAAFLAQNMVKSPNIHSDMQHYGSYFALYGGTAIFFSIIIFITTRKLLHSRQ